MPSTYTTSLKLTLPATGELAGTWGTTVNTGITTLVDDAVAGTASITVGGSDYTLTNTDGAANEARKMFITATGTPGAARNVIVPAVSKLYFVFNNTTGGFALTFKTSGGTGIAVAAGARMVLYCDGTNVVNALNAITLASPLPTSSGGTGLSSFTANRVFYASSTSAVAQSANLTFDGTTLTAAALSGPLNGTVGATTPASGAFTTLSATGNVNLNGGTFTFNDAGADLDARFEGDTDANLLFLDASTDRVGVGTNSPGTKLAVNDPGTGLGFTNAASGNFNLGLLGGTSSVDAYVYQRANGPLLFGTNNTERMRITSGGNVGIGTNAPSHPLDVNGIIRSDSWIGRANAAAPTADCAVFRPADNTLGFSTANTERMRITSGGDVGIGVTPSAWSVLKALQFPVGAVASFDGGAGNRQINLFNNAYYDGLSFRYVASDTALAYRILSGEHQWFNAPSGTAGNTISFTQAMTLDGSGNLLIGATSSPVSTAKIYTSDGTITSFYAYKTGGVEYAGTRSNHPLAFLTNNTERMRITAAGNISAGAGAVATTATDGFLYVPTCAGTPTGTPTAITGMAPIVVNTTNNKLYFYSGGAWRDAGP